MAAVKHPVELAGSLGVIEADPTGRVTGFEEKPVFPRRLPSEPKKALVNMGVYVFGRESLIDTLRKAAEFNGCDDIARDIVPVLTDSGRAMAFQFDGYWRDVGTLDLYYQTNLDLLLIGAPLDPYQNAAWPIRTLAGTRSLQRSWLASQSRVSLDATLTGCEVWMSIVSSGAHIDEDAQLEAAIVLPGARVGSGAKIRHAIVAENAVVANHARIGYDSQADRAQFPVSRNGIVIVGTPLPGQTVVPRPIPPSVKPLRSIAVAPYSTVHKKTVKRQWEQYDADKRDSEYDGGNK